MSLANPPVAAPVGEDDRSITRGRVIGSLLTTTLLLGLTIGFGHRTFGSFSAGMAFLGGEVIYVENPAALIDSGADGASSLVQYRVSNLSSHSVRLLGVKGSCACTKLEPLPDEILPYGHLTVRATIKSPGAKSPTSGTIRIFTDDGSCPEITLTHSVRSKGPVASQVGPAR